MSGGITYSCMECQTVLDAITDSLTQAHILAGGRGSTCFRKSPTHDNHILAWALVRNSAHYQQGGNLYLHCQTLHKQVLRRILFMRGLNRFELLC